ncbi:MAG: 50S ribosomal protein L21 [Alphaproteobacteria bacterium]
MYAVIRTGGKQYRIAPGDVIRVERLAGEAGATLTLDDVLMVGGDGAAPRLGAPVLAGASVKATVLEQDRNDKIIVFKKQRRQNHRRKRGHRQQVTVLRITDIVAKGGAA